MEQPKRHKSWLKTTSEDIFVETCIVHRLMFISLEDIHWDVRGLHKIVNGEWGSADFSELIVGTVMPQILGGDYRIARVDKTMPQIYKPDGLGMAAGVPDLLMAEVVEPSTWKASSVDHDANPGWVSVSVKRYKIYTNREDPDELAKRILLKAYKGLNEYLSMLPIPGLKFIVVLVENKHDAVVLTRALESIPKELVKDIQLRIIILDTSDEIKRMVFHYTTKDAVLIRTMTTITEDDDEAPWPEDIINVEIDSFGLDFQTLEFDWEAFASQCGDTKKLNKNIKEI